MIACSHRRRARHRCRSRKRCQSSVLHLLPLSAFTGIRSTIDVGQLPAAITFLARLSRGRGMIVSMWTVSWPLGRCDVTYATLVYTPALSFRDIEAVDVAAYTLRPNGNGLRAAVRMHSVYLKLMR